MLFEQELAGAITEELYEKSIPDDCSMPMQVHVQGMLCWGLMAAIRAGHTMNCDGCDENKVNYAAMLVRVAENKKRREEKTC